MDRIGDEPASEQGAEIAKDFDLLAMARSAIDSIEPETRIRVVEICDEFKIPAKNLDQVLWWTHRLSHFECKLKPAIKTKKKRNADLDKLKELSSELLSVLMKLDVEDAFELHKIGSDMAGIPPDQLVPGGLNHLQSTLVLLRCAAQSVRVGSDEIKAKTGGRISTVKHYSALVSGLWGVASEVGSMNLGRGGPFESFCSKLFAVAGIPASAEGAVRAFSEEQAKKTGVNQP